MYIGGLYIRTFGSHRSDGLDELAVEADTLVVLGGDPDEVGRVGTERGDLADGGRGRDAGDVRPLRAVRHGVASLHHVPRHRPAAVRRRRRPLHRHRVVGDADQTHRRRRTGDRCARVQYTPTQPCILPRSLDRVPASMVGGLT